MELDAHWSRLDGRGAQHERFFRRGRLGGRGDGARRRRVLRVRGSALLPLAHGARGRGGADDLSI